MPRCWMMVLVLFLALAAPASATELTGFGAIKFGMTREEAWAAIAGKGEWETADLLRYPYLIKQGFKPTHLEVKQEFNDGRAGNAIVEYLLVGRLPNVCSAEGLRYAGLIAKKYDVAPEVRYGMAQELRHGDKSSFMLEDNFDFVFESGRSVHIRSLYQYASEICEVTISYNHSDR